METAMIQTPEFESRKNAGQPSTTVDTSTVQEAMKRLNSFLESERASVASIVLQAQKKGAGKIS